MKSFTKALMGYAEDRYAEDNERSVLISFIWTATTMSSKQHGTTLSRKASSESAGKRTSPTSGKKKVKKGKKTLSVNTAPPPPPSSRRASSGATALAQMKMRKSSPANKLSKAKPTKLVRANTEPGTKKEKKSLTGKESRLEALAILKKASSLARPNVGAIVTIDELIKLEATVRAAAELNAIDEIDHTKRRGSMSLADMAKDSESGYLLDDELYNSLRNYMTVQVEKPKAKLQRVVKKLGMKAFSSKLLAAARASGGEVAAPEDDGEYAIEILPEYIEKSVNRWSFNVFEVEKETEVGSLVWVTEFLLQKSGLKKNLGVDSKYLRNWLFAVQEGYLEENSYHNQLHGADVCQTLYCMIYNSSFSDKLSDKMKYVALLAASAHDVGHVGVNNNFLVNTNDKLAITYCYEAPLEKMHASKGFEFMRIADSDVFHIFDGEELKTARHWFLNFILATDMAEHFHHISDLTGKIESSVGIEVKDDNDHALLVIGMLLHASDVSNPTKSWSYYNTWTERVMEEFYCQGDKERAANLRVSDGFDRTNKIPQSKFQNGFIAFIVKPLYEVLNRLDFLQLDLALSSIEDNLNNWKRTNESERRKSVMPMGMSPHQKTGHRRISKITQGNLAQMVQNAEGEKKEKAKGGLGALTEEKEEEEEEEGGGEGAGAGEEKQ
ncbi:hypothetical protein TrVE_jg8753 [Triparma verrucosa]|uniref:Phosphodiesterase n=1 Tax=Triparma verrucosa TaxID=1606542 RepID=A0A9W6ZEF2_9STRA|nr:hypothetical protein TrVE_jg8753 [Triparma verrucosa]